MALVKDSGRQSPLLACLRVTFDQPAGGVEPAIELPGNSVVIGGDIVVVTPWNGTTATLTLGDAGVANRYANAVDLKAAARTPLTVTGYRNTTITQMLANFALAGTATAGEVVITVQYYVRNRAESNQG